MSEAMPLDEDRLLELLEESRRRERSQTRFYRRLAAEAEVRGDAETAERMNALHADEQHHLSRLTARVLEMERSPSEPPPETLDVRFETWKERAREREDEEISWYQSLLDEPLDGETRRIVKEILASERHHRRELGGKWMPA